MVWRSSWKSGPKSNKVCEEEWATIYPGNLAQFGTGMVKRMWAVYYKIHKLLTWCENG